MGLRICHTFLSQFRVILGLGSGRREIEYRIVSNTRAVRGCKSWGARLFISRAALHVYRHFFSKIQQTPAVWGYESHCMYWGKTHGG